MKKKIIYGLMVVSTLLVCALGLNAANYKVAIVTKNDRIENFENSYLTNKINESKSDLENGKIVVDITLHNSESTEVLYVIDNGKTAITNKEALLAKVKEQALLVEQAGLINSAVITTTDGETTYSQFDTANISNAIDNISAVASSTEKDGEILTSLNIAKGKFNAKTQNKYIIIFTSSLPEDTESLRALVDDLANNNYNVIAYNIGDINQTEFDNAFTSAMKYTGIDSIDFSNTSSIIANKPSSIDDVNVKISFDKLLTENFTISNITSSKGQATYNDEDSLEHKEITVTPFSIDPNEDVVISYTLQTKQTVDASIIGKSTLRTARQVLLTGGINAELPRTTKIDETCSPTIMVVDETTTTNPNTGIYDYAVAGACMIAVALVTFVILNNKNEFNRI